jgi:hypothetical protein
MPFLFRRRALAFHTDRSIFGWSHPTLLAAALLIAAVGASQPAAAETPRERCRALTANGARAAAIAACDQAMLAHGSAEDLWASVEVRVARRETPTMEDLIRADQLAAAAKRLAPTEPWGDLARVDLALRWGDPALVAQRLEALEHAAPDDPRTHAAAALARPRRALFGLFAWGALLAAGAFTLAHAARRKLAIPRSARVPGAILALLAVSALLGRPAHAAAAAVFPIDDADPERAVPTQAQADARPLDFAYYLQDLTERAAAATKRGDHDAAVRYYRALVRAVPNSTVPQEKLRAALEARGPSPAARNLVRGARAAGIAAALLGALFLFRRRRMVA